MQLCTCKICTHLNYDNVLKILVTTVSVELLKIDSDQVHCKQFVSSITFLHVRVSLDIRCLFTLLAMGYYLYEIVLRV